MSRHWTVDELTDRLYGICEAAGERDEHFASCPACKQRFEELNRRRAATAVSPAVSLDISPAQWAAQRSAVLQRIDAPSRRMPRWVPALTAAACLVAAAIFAHRPVPIPSPASDTGNDAQLFADIYNVEESAEPRAAAPIHELFQEGQQ